MVTFLVVISTSYLGLRIVKNLKKLDNSAAKNFIFIFSLGVILYTLGELSFYFIFGSLYPSPADIFYVFGSILFIGAFAYVHAKLERKALSGKETLLFTFSMITTISIVCYLFYQFVIPQIKNFLFIENFLNFFYPITTLIIFLLALSYRVHSDNKGGYLFYISSSFFFIFLGDLFFIYAQWKDISEAISSIADILYLIGYLFMLFGVFLFYKRFKPITKRK